jgi:hypothetical protein
MLRPRPLSALLVPLLLAAALACAAPARAAYHALEDLPVESRLARAVEDVATSYGLQRAFHATRPWDRRDLRAFLDQVLAAAPAARSDPAVARIARELGADAPGNWAPLVSLSEGDRSVEVSPYVRADFAEDRARRAVARDFRGGVQASAALGRGALLFVDAYAGTTSPGPHGNPADSRHFALIEGVQVNSYLDRAYLKLDGSLGRLTIGHSWLRWGPGVTGGVGLSDGSRAFDFVEARTALLPTLQLEWFVASLDPVAETYLAGHRLEARVGRDLDVSVAELARFDGSSEAPLYLVPLIPYSLIEKRIIKSSTLARDSLQRLFKNNVMWTADATWRVNAGARVYGELAVDDVSFSSEKRPVAIAWLAGVETRRVAGADAVSARLELARVYSTTYSSYHAHDFAFAGMPTGYPLGPDARQLYARLAWDRGADWAFTLEGTLADKGEAWLGDAWIPGAPVPDNGFVGVVEHDRRAALGADWSPGAGLSLGGSLGWARLTALGHVSGRDERGLYGATRCTLRW